MKKKYTSTNLVACFRFDKSINLFPDSWDGKMDRFRLGVRTNAKKCRGLKQTRRSNISLTFPVFVIVVVYSLSSFSKVWIIPICWGERSRKRKKWDGSGKGKQKVFFLSKQSLWNMSHILGWLFASKVSVKITNHLLISDPILLLEHSLKDFFI